MFCAVHLLNAKKNLKLIVYCKNKIVNGFVITVARISSCMVMLLMKLEVLLCYKYLGGLHLIYSNRVRGRGYCKSDAAQLEGLSTDLFMLSGVFGFTI